MDISARNQIKGRVTNIQSGKAMTFVTIQADGMQLASAITNDGAHDLKLKQNDQVTAIVKATEVILAKVLLASLAPVTVSLVKSVLCSTVKPWASSK